MSISFSTEVLQSPTLLHRYLSGEESIERIQQRKPKSDELYFGRWQVVWIYVSYPLVFITSCVCQTLANLSYYLCLETCYRCLEVLSKRLVVDYKHLQSQNTYGNRLLVPSQNEHQLSSWDLYASAPLPVEKIRDESVREMTLKSENLKQGFEKLFHEFFHTLEAPHLSEEKKSETREHFLQNYKENGLKKAMEDLQRFREVPNGKKTVDELYKSACHQAIVSKGLDALNFYQGGGSCRGASQWFIHLYLKTQGGFASEEETLKAVAEEFTSGVPGEGALLQELFIAPRYLGLKMEKATEHDASLFDLDLERAQARAKIENLPNGIYRVGAYQHSLVFCKTGENDGFFWNPNIGLLKGGAGALFDHIIEKHYMRESPFSSIYFEHFESLGAENTETLEEAL